MRVLKFGGASLASAHHIESAAATIAGELEKVGSVVVVVSAMGNMTDQLYDLAKSVCSIPPKRELDMLVSSGERVSMALVAMALKERGIGAVSFTGSQSGIITSCEHQEAVIKELRLHRIESALALGKVVIVAGFQGMSEAREITTLGRGGSDTSSVALAIGLGADGVVFYKDVVGVYDDNPKYNSDAKLIEELSHDSALEMAQVDGFVVHERALKLAAKYKMPLTIQHYDPALRRLHQGTAVRSQVEAGALIEACGYE